MELEDGEVGRVGLYFYFYFVWTLLGFGYSEVWTEVIVEARKRRWPMKSVQIDTLTLTTRTRFEDK